MRRLFLCTVATLGIASGVGTLLLACGQSSNDKGFANDGGGVGSSSGTGTGSGSGSGGFVSGDRKSVV